MKTETKILIKANYQQLIFVFLAFFAMVFVSYHYVSDIVKGQMYVIGEEMMNTTEAAVSANLSETGLSFSNVVYTLESMLSAEKDNQEITDFLIDMNDYFSAERSPLPDFMKIYGYIRGEFLDGSGWIPPADYQPAQRPWYIGAEDNGGKMFFSEPYIDADTGGICISFSQKIFDSQGNAYGIIAMDLNLTRIAEYVRNQQLASNGYGILLSDTLNFAAHRDDSLIGINMAEAGGDYSILAQLIENNPAISAVRFVDVNGVDSIAFVRKIFNGWHIGVVTPWASYYEQVYSLGIMLSILGLVLMSALSYILVRTRAEKMRSDAENKSKSDFLSRMSHEMRTPMNAIIGMSDIAQNTQDMDKIQYCLEKISEASNHLIGVINDVLDMSKIEAGKLELSETEFSLEKMLQQVSNIMHFKIAEKQQKYTVQVDPEVPPSIIADQQRLSQAITNLLSNANKFTPEGGNIGLFVHNLGEDAGICTLQIDVVDDGIGIAPEQQLALFQSFEQADGSISRKFGGTGLGLAISKNILELMGGEIGIESELGKGARFFIRFQAQIGTATGALSSEPRAAMDSKDSKDTRDSTREKPALVLPFAGKRILLAEDVEINQEILVTMLSDTGVQIDWAPNGQEACTMFAAAQGAYHLIFMDIHMPEVDGYEATRRIRAMNAPAAKTIPIVAMTANVFQEDIEKCLAAVMDAHVGKPFELEEVLQIMQQYLCR